MKELKHYSILVLLALLFAACDNTPVIEVEQKRPSDEVKDNLINANKYMAEAEETQIDQYVSRRGWEMQRLTCGARVWEYERGKGKQLDFEDTVQVTYHVEALNGKCFYDQQSETFVLGRHQTVVGLDAAVMKLHRGSKARVVVPSEAAYGVVGDQENIPSRTVLVYDLKVE